MVVRNHYQFRYREKSGSLQPKTNIFTLIWNCVPCICRRRRCDGIHACCGKTIWICSVFGACSCVSSASDCGNVTGPWQCTVFDTGRHKIHALNLDFCKNFHGNNHWRCTFTSGENFDFDGCVDVLCNGRKTGICCSIETTIL